MTGPVPGSLEWTAQAAAGLVPSDPFAETPEPEHRPRSRPLSVIFRVDATDTGDARRQLEEVVVTAQSILAGLRPPTGNGGSGRPIVMNVPRPWDADPRGMGE